MKPIDPLSDLIAKFPKDFVNPFAGNDMVGVILLGSGIGLALRTLRAGSYADRIQSVAGYAKLGLDTTLVMLRWLFEVIPLAVLAIVAVVVGTTGFQPFVSLVWFVVTVIIGLAMMVCVYAVRLRLSSKIHPKSFFKGSSDAFALAFSTASSAATLPVTFACATEKLGIREESASLGIMAGGAFNHDGGAVFQTVAALFIAQGLGIHLGIVQQTTILLMSVFASVFVAGIPQGGFVTMVAVFNSVHLPIEYIPLLLPLDWILDRCRTTINVMGDLASTCIFDNR